MNDNLQKNNTEQKLQQVIQIIKFNRVTLSHGLSQVNIEGIQDWESLLKNLVMLFDAEKRWSKQNNTVYQNLVSYERDIRNIAGGISVYILSEHDNLKIYEDYKILLRQKYMAAGYFKWIYYRQYMELVSETDTEYYKALYFGLVEFYADFYGRFLDNEEAIALLCRYYPQKIDLQEYDDRMVKALYSHISSAGTPNDTGYAYEGIALIEQYIQKLPERLILKIIKQYSLFSIINSKVQRHQIFSMIDASNMEETTKYQLKFWYIDSILLADYFNRFLLRKMKNEGKDVNPFYADFDTKLGDENLQVFEKPMAYWKKTQWYTRVLSFEDYAEMIKIKLENEEINISYGRVVLKLPFNYLDWQSETYYHKKIEEWLADLEEKDIRPIDRQMTFSMLYLDNYRGLKEQLIDFDHKFQVDDEKQLISKRNADSMLHFYGKSVYSLSCIVGKNGTGKTSIVDFLRETFFKLLKIMEETGITCENGFIKEKDYEKYDILEKDAKFLILFSFGEKTYFLTNIKAEERPEIADALPFQSDAYMSTADFSKVVFFSSMLSSRQQDIFFEKEQKWERSEELTKAQTIRRILSNFRQIDYSEEESFKKKYRAINAAQLAKQKDMMEGKGKEAQNNNRRMQKNNANRELCYQLSLLNRIDAKKILAYLDMDAAKRFCISSNLYEEKEDWFSIEALQQDTELFEQLMEKYCRCLDAQLQHFSSGQYAKFSFLAKLYWFLNAGSKSGETPQSLVEQYGFDYEEVLHENETALIFIDEGELYYHPEWQRKYISTLLEFVNKVNTKVQIVLTTNSPFILSDILKEDVIYLVPEGEEEKIFDRTLGQNIHRLLKENFFMKFTIGEYAMKFIRKIMNGLQEKEKSEEFYQEIRGYFGGRLDEYEAVKTMIDQIGEPVYRYHLERLLEESPIMEKQKQIQSLEEEKRLLEEKIKQLKGESTSGKN